MREKKEEITHPTEGQVTIAQVYEAIVHHGATAARLSQYSSLLTVTSGEAIQCQRFRPRVDELYGLVQRIECDDWQQRSKDLCHR